MLSGEYAHLLTTEFWQKYSDRVYEARNGVELKLRKDNLAEPTVMGKVWQECLRLLDSIINLPAKLAAEE